MRVLAVVGQKGGSGKTTTAVCLAGALAAEGRRVLLVDLDPQASASSWLGVSEPGRGILDTLTDGRPLCELVQESATPNVSVVPASAWLTGVERVLAHEVGAETRLRRRMQELPSERWDDLLFDTPPTLGLLAVNALAAASRALVPVEAHVLPLHGVVQLMGTVEVVRERLNPELVVGGIVACRVSRTRHASEVVQSLRDRFGELVYRTVIRESVRLAECPSFGMPITSYAPKSPGACDYRALACELLAREEST